MAAHSAPEFFDVVLPQTLAKSPDKAHAIGGVLAFNITGDGGGEWTVDLSSATPHVTKGYQAGAQCLITVQSSDFVAMLSNPPLTMNLFMQGKLKSTGDSTMTMKVSRILSL